MTYSKQIKWYYENERNNKVGKRFNRFLSSQRATHAKNYWHKEHVFTDLIKLHQANIITEAQLFFLDKLYKMSDGKYVSLSGKLIERDYGYGYRRNLINPLIDKGLIQIYKNKEGKESYFPGLMGKAYKPVRQISGKRRPFKFSKELEQARRNQWFQRFETIESQLKKQKDLALQIQFVNDVDWSAVNNLNCSFKINRAYRLETGLTNVAASKKENWVAPDGLPISDIDVVKCHPALAAYLFGNYAFCHKLQNAVTRQMAEDLGITEKEVKNQFNTILHAPNGYAFTNLPVIQWLMKNETAFYNCLAMYQQAMGKAFGQKLFQMEKTIRDQWAIKCFEHNISLHTEHDGGKVSVANADKAEHLLKDVLNEQFEGNLTCKTTHSPKALEWLNTDKDIETEQFKQQPSLGMYVRETQFTDDKDPNIDHLEECFGSIEANAPPDFISITQTDDEYRALEACFADL